MQFGVFDHMDRGAGPLDQFYADRLAIVERYDREGFYGYHVAEHHATPLGLSPSPVSTCPRSRNARGACASAHSFTRCHSIIHCG